MPRVYKAIDSRLRNYFRYCQTSPTGLADLQGNPVGQKLRPSKSRTEYWMMDFEDERYCVHRVIWLLCTGSMSQTLSIDHLDGNGLNNLFSNLKEKTHRANCQNKHKQVTNTSGQTGVYKNIKRSPSGTETHYWMASWVDAALVQRTKCFRIDRLGDEEAFKAAIEHRAAMIQSLQIQGQTYTERHGLH